MAKLDDDKLETGEDKPLGLAGTLTKTFIHSPITPLLLIASLALGFMGLLLTPRQEDPQISVPIADIFFQFPGASADQVSSLATDPLERMMSEIPGVRHVYSASERGRGMVTVQFRVGEEMGPSLVKLYDKLMSNQDKIPPGVSQPLVKPKGIDDVPAVALTLWSDTVDDASLRQLALEVMQRLKEVENTAASFVVGGRPEELRIEIKPERLSGFGISIGHLAQTIASANEKRAVGNSEIGGSSMKIYSGSFLRTASDVESLIVGVRNGSPVYVRDVATVTAGPGDAKSVVQYFTGPAAEKDAIKTNGSPAVTIAIAKKVGTNGVTVANGILAKVEALKGTLIPDNVHVEVTRNYGKTANNKVNELMVEMLTATSVVTILIFFFLGFRPTLVVVIVIPVIILMTIFAAYMLNFTVDRVSLFALIFSIGILVDDAAVVVENTYRRWLQKGSIDTATTIDAIREVGNPTVLATMTVIAALLPMAFVSGMMGPYMRPIPVLGSVAMLLSLFAAFIFTPWLAMRIRPSLSSLRKMQDAEHRSAARMDGIVRRVLGPLLDSPRKARIFRLCLWGALILACSMFYFQIAIVKMLPLDNKPEYNVVVNMPDGTSLPQTANLIEKLTEKVRTLPEVTAVQTYAGTASPYNFNGLVRHYYLRRQPWQGDIQIQLLDKHDRKRTSHQLALVTRDMLTPIAKAAGARIQVVEMPPGPPVLQTMVAEIYGPDAKTRRQVARDVTKIFEKAGDVTDVDNLMADPHQVWTFEVDQRKAEYRNVSISSLNNQLSMVMGDHKLGDIKRGGELEPTYIILQAPLSARSRLNNMTEMPIVARDGKAVPLGELGSFVKTPSDPTIFHKDLRPVEFVTGEVTGRLAAPVYGMLSVSKLMADYKTPDGVTMKPNVLGFSGNLLGPPAEGFKSDFEWTGEWTVTYETFRDMGLAFMAALVLIYMLIVLEFGNFRLPGIIMAPIPLTLLGIIPGHWLMGAEFTATSMIGWIALAGIIVRNSILLVDFSKQAVAEGMDHREAVIQAVRTRARPILITSMAMIAGSFGIIFDPIFQGMAISLLFGAIVSTALTLIVIPLSCFQAPGAYRSSKDSDPDQEYVEPVHTPVAAKQQPAQARKSDTARAGLLSRIGGGIAAAVTIAKIIPVFTWHWLQSIVGSLAPAKPALAKMRDVARDAPVAAWDKVRARRAAAESGKGLGKEYSEFKQTIRKAVEAPETTTSQDSTAATIDKVALEKQRATEKVVQAAAALESAKMKNKKDKKKKSKKVKLKKAEAKKQKDKKANEKAKPKARADAAKARADAKRAEAEKAARIEEKIRADAARAERQRLEDEAENTRKMAELEQALRKAAKDAEQKAADKQREAEAKRLTEVKEQKAKSKKDKKKASGKKKQQSVKAEKTGKKKKSGKKKKAAKPRQDLKLIKGIGPKVELELNRLGITRFKQIAKWSHDDIEELQMQARMSLRMGEGSESWITQAKILASGRHTEFSRRVDEGKVPSSQNHQTYRGK
ncbi:MAG TPA: AcrB/AcrD/AcrF family protein [Rhizobiales bacterium]|nr:AcrB/AcrD/AcrF family protein [Hyphomicrobiales bacterium]